MKTIRDIAQSALDVQNASNLSGVVHSFSKLMTLLGEQGLNSEEKNRHPAVILYSNKIASLCGSESGAEFARAYEWAMREIEKGEDNIPIPLVKRVETT
jgi:hypothetical protein